MQYTEDQIKDIEKNILNDMNSKEQLNQEIIEAADEVASMLLKNKTCRYQFQETTYLFKVKITKQKIFVVCANEFKYKLANQKYIPWTASVDNDIAIPMKENVAEVIRGLFGHFTGNIEVVQE